MDLFEAADLPVRRDSSVSYKATIDDPGSSRCGSCAPGDPDLRRGRPVRPRHHRSGLGRGDRFPGDVAGELRYSKATTNPITVVVAVPGDSEYRSVSDLPSSGCGCPPSTPSWRAVLRRQGASTPTSGFSYGATEAKVPDIVDCVVDITETGTAPSRRGQGHRRDDPGVVYRVGRQPGGLRRSRQAPRHGAGPRRCSGRARGPQGKVLVKLNVATDALDAVIECCPP